MLIQGGFNENEQLLNDMHLFNVKSESFIPVNDYLGCTIPELAMHTCVSVTSADIETSSLNSIYSHTYRLCETNSADGVNLGYYIFGGLVNKRKQKDKDKLKDAKDRDLVNVRSNNSDVRLEGDDLFIDDHNMTDEDWLPVNDM